MQIYIHRKEIKNFRNFHTLTEIFIKCYMLKVRIGVSSIREVLLFMLLLLPPIFDVEYIFGICGLFKLANHAGTTGIDCSGTVFAGYVIEIDDGTVVLYVAIFEVLLDDDEGLRTSILITFIVPVSADI